MLLMTFNDYHASQSVGLKKKSGFNDPEERWAEKNLTDVPIYANSAHTMPISGCGCSSMILSSSVVS